MVGKTRKATAKQKKRMETIKVLGCVACLLDGVLDRHATVHHILAGGIGSKRLGHDFTIGLCDWHHQATCNRGLSLSAMCSKWGPSLAHSPRKFVEQYGSERELLEIQNFILGAFESEPWADYTMPAFMRSQVREFWIMDQKS